MSALSKMLLTQAMALGMVNDSGLQRYMPEPIKASRGCAEPPRTGGKNKPKKIYYIDENGHLRTRREHAK